MTEPNKRPVKSVSIRWHEDGTIESRFRSTDNRIISRRDLERAVTMLYRDYRKYLVDLRIARAKERPLTNVTSTNPNGT